MAERAETAPSLPVWIDAFIAWEEERLDEVRRAHEEGIRAAGQRHGEGIGYTRGHAAGREDGAKEIVRKIGEPELRQALRIASRELADAYAGASREAIDRLMREHMMPRREAEQLARRIADEADFETRVPSYEPGFISYDHGRAETVQLAINSYHRRIVIMHRGARS